MYFPSDPLLESWILKDHMSIRDSAAGEDVPVMNRSGRGKRGAGAVGRWGDS